jgi:hypothetical protein
MAAIYLYACVLFGWGGILGVLIWLQVGVHAFLWSPKLVEQVGSVQAMLDDADAAQRLLAEVQVARDELGEL